MNICGSWLTAWFILLLQPCFAQQKPAVLTEMPDEEAAPGISIAFSPKNPSIVVAAVGPDRIFHSSDGGSTWTNARISSVAGFFGSPAVVSDSRGTFYLIHATDPSGKGHEDDKSFESLVCHVSDDGGKTWDAGTAFASTPGKDLLYPAATVDSKGNVWATWTQFDRYQNADSSCRSTIAMASSPNGRKWSAPVALSQVKGACLDSSNSVAGATIAASDDKRVYACWGNQQLIFLDRSFDRGGMWLTNDILIANQTGGWDINVPGHTATHGKPVLLVDRSRTERKGLLYLAWADQRNGNSDIWFSRSNNFGDIWTSPLKVNNGSEKQHRYLPAMTIDNASGDVYILYYTRKDTEGTETNVYLAYSPDAGTSFRNIKINDTHFLPSNHAFNGRQLDVVAQNGRIYCHVGKRRRGEVQNKLCASEGCGPAKVASTNPFA